MSDLPYPRLPSPGENELTLMHLGDTHRATSPAPPLPHPLNPANVPVTATYPFRSAERAVNPTPHSPENLRALSDQSSYSSPLPLPMGLLRTPPSSGPQRRTEPRTAGRVLQVPVSDSAAASLAAAAACGSPLDFYESSFHLDDPRPVRPGRPRRSEEEARLNAHEERNLLRRVKRLRAKEVKLLARVRELEARKAELCASLNISNDE